MQSFRDSREQKWEIDLNFGTLLRIKKESKGKYDLLDDGTGKLAGVLLADYLEFYEVLWLAVEPQAAKLNIGAEEFGERIAASCIVEAQQAFFTEYIDFFQKLQRPETAKVLEKMTILNRRARKMAQAKMEAVMGGDFDQRAEAKIDHELNKASGNLEALLDKTLALTPGDNST